MIDSQASGGIRRLRPGLVELAFQAKKPACPWPREKPPVRLSQRRRMRLATWISGLKGQFYQPRPEAANAAGGLGYKGKNMRFGPVRAVQESVTALPSGVGRIEGILTYRHFVGLYS